MAQKRERIKNMGDDRAKVSDDTVIRKCVLSFVIGAFFVGTISVVFDLARYKMREGEFPELKAFILGVPVDGCECGESGKSSEHSEDTADKADNALSGSALDAGDRAPKNGADVVAHVCHADAEKKQMEAFDAVKKPLVDALSICGINESVGIRFDVNKRGEVRVLDVTGETLVKTDIGCVTQFVKEQAYPLDAICAEQVSLDWRLDLSVGKKTPVDGKKTEVMQGSVKRSEKTAVESKPSTSRDTAAKTVVQNDADRSSTQAVNVAKKVVIVNPEPQNVVPSGDIPPASQKVIQVPSLKEGQKDEPVNEAPKAERADVLSTVKSMMAAKLMLAEIECQAEGTLRGTAVLRSDGSLKNVRVGSGSLKGTAAESCIVGKLAGISGSPFVGVQEVISWSYPAE